MIASAEAAFIKAGGRKMKPENLGTAESRLLCLQALMRSDEVGALSAPSLRTTRVSNLILSLRRQGIEIATITKTTANGKHFGSYRLVITSSNLDKAQAALDELTEQEEARKRARSAIALAGRRTATK
jgi:hypothetical protein